MLMDLKGKIRKAVAAFSSGTEGRDVIGTGNIFVCHIALYRFVTKRK